MTTFKLFKPNHLKELKYCKSFPITVSTRRDLKSTNPKRSFCTQKVTEDAKIIRVESNPNVVIILTLKGPNTFFCRFSGHNLR